MILPYIIFSYLGLFLYGLCDNLRGPLFPELLREFALTHTQGAWFFATCSIFGFIGNSLCLQTLQKIDRVQNQYIGLFFLTVGLIGLGLSQNYAQLLVASAGLGLGFGMVSVTINLLSTVGSDWKFRQRVVSGLHSMYGLASFLAPLLMTLIYFLGGNWRWCFFFCAAVTALMGIVMSFFLRRESLALPQPAPEGIPVGSARGIFIVAISTAGYVMAEILIGTRLSLYLRLEKDFDMVRANSFVTGFFICLLASRIFFSVMPPRMAPHRLLLVSVMSSAISMTLGILVDESFLLLTGFFMGPYFATSIIYLSKVFPQALNRAMSIAAAAQSFFVVTMHLSSGWLTDSLGIGKAMFLGPMALVASGVLLIGFERWKKS